MATGDYADFEAEARAAGFDEVLQKRWDPAQVLPLHAHPYGVRLRVVEGEMWLGTDGGGEARHLGPGDECLLERGARHHERYGPEGALVWVARRHGGAA